MEINITDKKNQHYVPKLYLRLFSFNQNYQEIGIYNLRNNFFKNRVPIKSQAKGDFFYGKDGFVEDWLQNLENNAAPVIKRIINENKLPVKISKETIYLYTFCLIFTVRTKEFAEGMQESVDSLFQKAISLDSRKEQFKGYELRLNEPAALGVLNAIDRIKYALDLKVKLLLNKTDIDFLTSDTPLSPYNQFLESRAHPGGHCGLYTKGLQLFIPISPKHLLIFYDEWVYRIGDKKNDVLELKNDDDINTLNSLQIMDCYEQLYFNEKINLPYIERMLSRSVKFRKESNSVLREAGRRIDKDGNERIQFHLYNQNILANLKFSFITQTKQAKKIILNDFVVQLRDERLRNFRKDNYHKY